MPVHVGPYVPPGHRKTSSGRLRVEPTEAAVIGDLFERRAAGEPWVSLDRLLEEHGIPDGPRLREALEARRSLRFTGIFTDLQTVA